MQILWISQNLPYPPKTGVLQRNYHLIREVSRFADVHLVAILKENVLPAFDEQTARRELGKLCSRVDVVRLPVEGSRLRLIALVLRSLVTRAPFTANWAASATLEATLRDAVASTRYDVVYFDTISLARYRQTVDGTAKVLNHHNVESHLLQRRIRYEANPLRRFYFGLEARKLHRYEAEVGPDFATHLVCSALDGERLRAISPGISTAVIANGVDVDYFHAADVLPEPAHLVMVSGMNWFPNRDAVRYMVREIWPTLSAALPHAKLTIVGASPPPEVIALTRTDPRVVATGFVDDVRPYIERAQVYLCPMRDGGGTRLKILDALAMGRVIVATTMALEGIDVQAERDVLIADTPAEFVRQTERAIADPALRARIGANARRVAEQQYSWPVIGRHLERTFAGLAGGRNTSTVGV